MLSFADRLRGERGSQPGSRLYSSLRGAAGNSEEYLFGAASSPRRCLPATSISSSSWTRALRSIGLSSPRRPFSMRSVQDCCSRLMSSGLVSQSAFGSRPTRFPEVSENAVLWSWSSRDSNRTIGCWLHSSASTISEGFSWLRAKPIPPPITRAYLSRFFSNFSSGIRRFLNTSTAGSNSPWPANPVTKPASAPGSGN